MDHAKEAERHIVWAHDQQESDGQYESSVRDNALLAQVHAILALAEQARIANVLGALRLAAAPGFERRYLIDRHPDIARTLGLDSEGDE